MLGDSFVPSQAVSPQQAQLAVMSRLKAPKFDFPRFKSIILQFLFT